MKLEVGTLRDEGKISIFGINGVVDSVLVGIGSDFVVNDLNG